MEEESSEGAKKNAAGYNLLHKKHPTSSLPFLSFSPSFFSSQLLSSFFLHSFFHSILLFILPFFLSTQSLGNNTLYRVQFTGLTFNRNPNSVLSLPSTLSSSPSSSCYVFQDPIFFFSFFFLDQFEYKSRSEWKESKTSKGIFRKREIFLKTKMREKDHHQDVPVFCTDSILDALSSLSSLLSLSLSFFHVSFFRPFSLLFSEEKSRRRENVSLSFCYKFEIRFPPLLFMSWKLRPGEEEKSDPLKIFQEVRFSGGMHFISKKRVAFSNITISGEGSLLKERERDRQRKGERDREREIGRERR